MSENSRTRNRIINARVKPLNGVPMISANCWDSVLTAVAERVQESTPVRFLEWGAGNSTVSILKHSLEEDYRVELTSVEHATSFFPYLVGSLINLLIEKGADFDMEWRTLKGPHLDFSEVRRVLRERRTRENHLLLWEVLSGNKRVQFVDGYEPDFRLSPFRMAKQLAKLALVETTFWRWCAKGMLRSMGARRKNGNKGVVCRYGLAARGRRGSS